MTQSSSMLHDESGVDIASDGMPVVSVAGAVYVRVFDSGLLEIWLTAAVVDDATALPCMPVRFAFLSVVRVVGTEAAAGIGLLALWLTDVVVDDGTGIVLPLILCLACWRDERERVVGPDACWSDERDRVVGPEA